MIDVWSAVQVLHWPIARKLAVVGQRFLPLPLGFLLGKHCVPVGEKASDGGFELLMMMLG